MDNGFASLFEIPVPFVFNCWKHHKLFIQNKIERIDLKHAGATVELKQALIKIGRSQMDLYTGMQLPKDITFHLMSMLIPEGIINEKDYREWIRSSGKNYRIVEIAEGSKWTMLNINEQGRYIHIHPAKYSSFSVRVRSLELKTAIAVLVWTNTYSGSAFDIQVINKVRKELIGESPLKSVIISEGLGKVIRMLSD